MSFVKRLWKDRVSQYPNRRAIYDGSFSKSVTVSRDEGTITEAGDPFNAENMNDLEDRIEDGLDEKATMADVEDYLKGVYPESEVSGAMASFNPGVMLPLRSCECQINATLAGTGDPSPSNVRAILGYMGINIIRAGKNLLDIAHVTSNSNAQYKAFGALISTNTPDGTLFLPQGTYTFSVSDTMELLNARDDNGDLITSATSTNSLTFTLSKTTKLKITLSKGNGDWSNYTYQLELGSTATAYEAYKGNTYNISWQTQAGTVYSGYIDVTTGELIVTHAKRAVNELGWYYANNKFYSSSVALFPTGASAFTGDFVCSFAKPANKNWLDLADGECSLVRGLYSAGYYSLAVNNTNYTSAVDFKNALTDACEITYPLVNPLVYQLTPTQIKTLLNQNNIYHDCNGDIDVIFHKEITAKNISFDNSGTTLTATNVEDAIKEVLGRIG